LCPFKSGALPDAANSFCQKELRTAVKTGGGFESRVSQRYCDANSLYYKELAKNEKEKGPKQGTEN
jgi:hypothetical protein